MPSGPPLHDVWMSVPLESPESMNANDAVENHRSGKIRGIWDDYVRDEERRFWV